MEIKKCNRILSFERHIIFMIVFLLFLFSSMKIEREVKVGTGSFSEIATTFARATGNIIDSGEGILDHGHCWSTNPNPTISLNTKT